jgi:hypothetical protein
MAGDALLSRFGNLENFLAENRAWRNTVLSLQLEAPSEEMARLYWDQIMMGIGADIYLGVTIADLVNRRVAVGFSRDNALLPEEQEAYQWVAKSESEKTPMYQKLISCDGWPPEWLTIMVEEEARYNRRMEANLNWFAMAKRLQATE